MKGLIVLCLSAVALTAADRTTQAQPALPRDVPAGAVAAGPATWQYTDGQGNKWIYRKTPFGVVRLEDKPVAPAPAESGQGLKAVDAGEFVRFERPGPFGTYRWQTKKSELSEMERAAWERAQAVTAAKQE